MQFTPDILNAVKDAGIPVAALVGILSVFFAIVSSQSKNNENRLESKRLFYVVTMACITIASMIFMFWSSTITTYAWIDTKYSADFGGNDEGWTVGRLPEKPRCDITREGQIAICWSNRPSGHPGNVMFYGETKDNAGPGAWCTYKILDKPLGAPNGSAPGRMFVCARTSI